MLAFLIPQLKMPRHVTQFTEIGWNYLLNGTGSGELPNGGYYATWVDPKSTDFTMNIVKISRAWSCNEGEGILKALLEWSSQMPCTFRLKSEVQHFCQEFSRWIPDESAGCFLPEAFLR